LLGLFLTAVWPLSVLFFFKSDYLANSLPGLSLITEIYLPTIALHILILIATLSLIKKPAIGLDRIAGRHIVQAVIFSAIAIAALFAIKAALGSVNFFKFDQAGFLFPQTLREKLCWGILAVTAALAEETAYRGYMIDWMINLLGAVAPAVIISSLSFAIGHSHQGSGMGFLLFLMGLGLALLRLKSKSLWPCIASHLIFNLLTGFTSLQL